MANRENNVNLNNSLEASAEGILYKNFKRGLIFLFIFIIFTLNFLALSIALQCNSDKNIFYRFSSGLFAFMFGFLYIIMNYLMFRVNLKSYPCEVCSDFPFPFGGKDVY